MHITICEPPVVLSIPSGEKSVFLTPYGSDLSFGVHISGVKTYSINITFIDVLMKH